MKEALIEPWEELYLRLGRTIVERGFATSHVYDMKGMRGRFVWTRKGLEFRRHLFRLFDIPDSPVESHSGDYIAALISLILYTNEAVNPPNAAH